MAEVTIGCRLPHGLVLEHPIDPKAKAITLNGANKETIIGAGYGTTQVDADFWTMWKNAHKSLPALSSGAIFEAKTASAIVAAAKEVEAEVTGFERMPQKAHGVKKRTDKDE